MISPIKVLVFGKNGQVGSHLVKLFSGLSEFEVVGADIDEIDLTDLPAIHGFISNYGPRWLINASGHTAVDRAESEEKLSYLLNSAAPEEMARCCALIGCHFVHYSTDYVFDGTSRQPYIEADITEPRSIYGQSKVSGEIAVLRELPDALIFRTAWVYSKQGKNFVNTMLQLAENRPELSVVNDQFGSPTFADDLAEATVNVVVGIVAGKYKHQGGIFHATGQGKTNWYEFCKEILILAEHTDVLVKPISTREYPTAAPRPAFSVLSNEKLKNSYAQTLPHWRDALTRFFNSS